MARPSKPKILSIDGGGIRGLSSLLILQRILHQLRCKLEEPNLEPHHYFDLIGGTGTGGIIALMLGRLCMSIEECILEYNNIIEEVFSNHQNSGQDMFKAEDLENTMKRVIGGKLGSNQIDAPLFDSDSSAACKTILFTLAKAHPDAVEPTKLRTYKSRIESPTKCTIWQAARAVSATPMLFPPIRLKLSLIPVEYIDASMGFKNPSEAILTEVGRIWGDKHGKMDFNKEIGCFLSLGTGFLKIARLTNESITEWITKKFQIPHKVAEVLENIATDTEKSHRKMQNWFDDKFHIYHRFNVEQGLQDTQLFEYEKIEDLAADTGVYLDINQVKIHCCVERMFLLEPSPSVTWLPKLTDVENAPSKINRRRGSRAITESSLPRSPGSFLPYAPILARDVNPPPRPPSMAHTGPRRMTLFSPSIEDYYVGWICAIQTEYVVALELLDEKFRSPDLSIRDNNAYTFGRIGYHYVVVTCLAKGKVGLSSAASVAGDMLRSFPAIHIGLMVGVGGGAPSENHDIRLGDVVVSTPKEQRGGVVHYEFGKAIQNEMFKCTGSLDAPPPVLLSALQKLSALHECDGHQIASTVANMVQKNTRLQKKYRKPSPQTDILFQSSFCHLNDNQACTELCIQQTNQIVQRPIRDPNDGDPVIHYGLIASADRLVKDTGIRDHLAKTEGVLCFEMEAAGLMDRFPCVVIRGICDYSDTHKNKAWQGYAAATAAAYAKELLKVIPKRNRVSKRR